MTSFLSAQYRPLAPPPSSQSPFPPTHLSLPPPPPPSPYAVPPPPPPPPPPPYIRPGSEQLAIEIDRLLSDKPALNYRGQVIITEPVRTPQLHRRSRAIEWMLRRIAPTGWCSELMVSPGQHNHENYCQQAISISKSFLLCSVTRSSFKTTQRTIRVSLKDCITSIRLSPSSFKELTCGGYSWTSNALREV
jgi:hypothetical protein